MTDKPRWQEYAPPWWAPESGVEAGQDPCFEGIETTEALNVVVAPLDLSQLELQNLRARVARLEQQLGSKNQPSYFEVRDAIDRVKSITIDLFSEEYRILEREDCELDDDRHFTFRVTCCGEAAERMRHYDLWHERLSEVPIGVRGMFRLSLDARK